MLKKIEISPSVYNLTKKHLSNNTFFFLLKFAIVWHSCKNKHKTIQNTKKKESNADDLSLPENSSHSRGPKKVEIQLPQKSVYQLGKIVPKRKSFHLSERKNYLISWRIWTTLPVTSKFGCVKCFCLALGMIRKFGMKFLTGKPKRRRPIRFHELSHHCDF